MVVMGSGIARGRVRTTGDGVAQHGGYTTWSRGDVFVVRTSKPVENI